MHTVGTSVKVVRSLIYVYVCTYVHVYVSILNAHCLYKCRGGQVPNIRKSMYLRMCTCVR